MNAAGDGSTAGAWETLATAGGPGPHGATAAVGVPDGVHAWRVVAHDVAGNAGVTAAPDRIVADTTPPSLELHDVPSGWVRNLELDLTATDNLQSALGLGATQVNVNAAGDGGEGGTWLTRSSAAAAPGRRVVHVELAGLPDGRHLVRVLVRNGGPFGERLATERRVTVRVNRSPPAIARVDVRPRRRHCSPPPGSPTTLSPASRPRPSSGATGGAWRTLASQQASDGAGSMSVDVSSVPRGERTFRLVAADAAGNVAARQGEARLRAGAGSTAADPFARLRTARLSVRVARARHGRVGGRRVIVARVAIGGTVAVSGRLRDARGRPSRARRSGRADTAARSSGGR